jgi:hypothetical protein
MGEWFVSFKHHGSFAYSFNRKKRMVWLPNLYMDLAHSFNHTASVGNQFVEYCGWSLSGRNCGHFRPLTAYTVTRHILPEATPMPRNLYCVVAGSAQDVEVPSQAAVNGHSPLRRAFTVKKGPPGPKPVVVDIPYITNSYLRCGALGFESRERCSLHQ